MVRLTFLGTGTSMGVPMFACDCRVCRSADPRDKRSRSSVLVTVDGRNILVDTSTDLYYQALGNNVKLVDAVLYTHSHADHVHGIDELRRFNHVQREEIKCYGKKETIESIRSIFKYIFTRKPDQLDIPQLTTEAIDGAINLFGLEITPIDIYHGEQTIFGYRFNRRACFSADTNHRGLPRDLKPMSSQLSVAQPMGCAYLTDCSGIPEESMELLGGLDVLIIDALRYRPHKNHFNYDEALEMIARLNPKVAYLTHLTHDYLYEEMQSKLPENVKLPYDGLILDI